jgi:chromosome segregation protein
MEQWRQRWEQIGEELAAAERAIEVEDTRLEQLTTQGQRLDKERQRHAEERASMSFEEIEARLTTLVGNEQRLVVATDDATRALDTVWQQIQQLREQDRKISQHLDQLREQLQTGRGRLTSLEALQQAAIGKSTAQVDRWLGEQSLIDRQRLAQELNVEKGWERAVETVLGPYLQALTVDSLDGVADSLPTLTEGGVTLLERRASVESAPAADSLRARVTGPANIAGLIGNVRVAETLEQAFALRAGLASDESIITPEGFWVGPHWVRINRSDDPQVGVIARGEEIKRLTENVDATAKRVDEVAKALADTRFQLERLEEARVAAQSEVGRRQQLHVDTKTNLATTRNELEQMRARAAALDHALADLESEQQASVTALAESRGRRETSVTRQREAVVTREDFERQRRDHQERVAEARSLAERHRELAQSIAIKVESRRSSKESASAALTRVQAQLAHLSKRRAELQTALDAAAAPLAADEHALAGKLDERLTVEAELGNARNSTEEIDQRLREVEEQRIAKQRLVNELREAADNARLGVREAQVRTEAITEQFTETGFQLEQVSAELPAEATAELWHDKFEQLERRIQRLGAINLAAIDEFQEQSERKKYLDSQFADLNEALETLENAIRKIDRETRTRFKETFDKANQGLGRLFPRLFGGGHAYLELNGDDLLGSGVTVMARPPGKKNSTIHLLSGGEKALTAVALVFSIFELNPAPFCLLDEVDAPLDDANVGRFSEIVREMSEHVQFVIITHNKTTMESMHQLTGVTMNEPGVSRMVAVDIDEAVKLAAM